MLLVIGKEKMERMVEAGLKLPAIKNYSLTMLQIG